MNTPLIERLTKTAQKMCGSVKTPCVQRVVSKYVEAALIVEQTIAQHTGTQKPDGA